MLEEKETNAQVVTRGLARNDTDMHKCTSRTKVANLNMGLVMSIRCDDVGLIDT